MARPKKEIPRHTSGMYEYKATIGHTFDGKPIRKSFYSKTSKDTAKAKANDYIINQKVAEQTGTNFVSTEMPFEKWANTWLETYKKPNVKEHTYKWTYKTNIDNYFVPFFKNARLTSITQANVQLYFNKHKHLALSSLQRQKFILYDIFDMAIENDYCTKNPVKKINIVSDKPKLEKKTYTEKQAFELSTILKNYEKWGLAIYIALNYGLRRGELIGLMWKDIDITNKILYVNRAVEPDTVGIPIDGELKSQSSQRAIPIDDDFCDYLNQIKKENDFVISSDDEFGYCSISTFDKEYKKCMREITSKLKLPYLTPHELRHTCGTVLREKGLDLYSISRILGHSDSKISEKVYVHNDIEVLRKRIADLK